VPDYKWNFLYLVSDLKIYVQDVGVMNFKGIIAGRICFILEVLDVREKDLLIDRHEPANILWFLCRLDPFAQNSIKIFLLKGFGEVVVHASV